MGRPGRNQGNKPLLDLTQLSAFPLSLPIAREGEVMLLLLVPVIVLLFPTFFLLCLLSVLRRRLNVLEIVDQPVRLRVGACSEVCSPPSSLLFPEARSISSCSPILLCARQESLDSVLDDRLTLHPLAGSAVLLPGLERGVALVAGFLQIFLIWPACLATFLSPFHY